MTLEDLRCSRCGALLARVVSAPGSRIEILCKRCKSFNSVVGAAPTDDPAPNGSPSDRE